METLVKLLSAEHLADKITEIADHRMPVKLITSRKNFLAT
jgi:hypothetical protein